MKPPKPPRHIAEVNADPTRPHTPIPEVPTARPPPPMPMLPPKEYAAPRGRLGSFHGAERRPEPANPPPPESLPPAAPERVTELPAGHVTVGKGKWTLSMPSAVALALIACLGGALTAWINKSDPGTIAKTLQQEMAKAAEDRKLYEDASTARYEGLETKVGAMKESVDSLRARFNDRFPLPAQPVDPLAAPMNKQLAK